MSVSTKAALMSLLSVLISPGLSAVKTFELEPHPSILFMLFKLYLSVEEQIDVHSYYCANEDYTVSITFLSQPAIFSAAFRRLHKLTHNANYMCIQRTQSLL